MQAAIARAPAEFVAGWLGNIALPYGLRHREAEQGVEAVIREFFWNHSEKDAGRMDKLARAFPHPPAEGRPQSEAEFFRSSMLGLAEICPSLAYGLAKHKLRGDKYRKYVRAVAAALLQQPGTTDLSQLRCRLLDACRDCARLVGMVPDTVERSVKAFGDHLDNQPSNYGEVEPDLRRLGETVRGRPFVAASLLLRLVERTGS